jgi:hypothetical protein
MHLRLPPSPPNTFPKFAELPAELRCLIWKMALPGSRIILLEHRRKKDDAISLKSGMRIDRLGFRADSPPPSILLVCHEAYEVASRYYTPAFSNARGTSVPETYFDFKTDVLYLGPEYIGPTVDRRLYQERILYVIEHELHHDDLSRVENLAIWFDNFFRGPFRLTIYLSRLLSHFSNIKSVTIVNKKYCMPGFRDTYPNMHGELKFLDNMLKVAGSNITIQGFPIPRSKDWISDRPVDVTELEQIRNFPQNYDIFASKSWNIPSISYNVITTPHGEELLLQEAREAMAEKLWGSRDRVFIAWTGPSVHVADVPT